MMPNNSVRVTIHIDGELVYRETFDTPTYTYALRIVNKIKKLVRW